MPIRQPIPFGNSYEAISEPKAYAGADIYGPGSIPENRSTLDVVTYDTPYYFTGFEAAHFVPMHTTPFLYNPRDTVPLENPSDIGQGPDYFYAIERVEFTNGMYLIAANNDPATAVEGLYDYIGRETPDRAGFEFWLDGLDRGASLDAIVDVFIAAKAEAAKTGEFGIVADATDNREFVLSLYEDVLGYGGTEEGMAFWSGNLDSGAADRGDVLAEFVKVVGDSPAYDPWIEWA